MSSKINRRNIFAGAAGVLAGSAIPAQAMSQEQLREFIEQVLWETWCEGPGFSQRMTAKTRRKQQADL